MGARFWRWLRDPDHRRDEKSNSFAMFVVMLPVILGAFGMGVDLSRNFYIRDSLQHSLDAAVVGGAAITEINPAIGKVQLGAHGAFGPAATNTIVQAVEEVYAENRNTGPGLSCTGTGVVSGTSLPKCWTQPTAPQVTYNSVFYAVQEQSKNAFLPIIGITYQHYHLTSKAVINQRTQ